MKGWIKYSKSKSEKMWRSMRMTCLLVINDLKETFVTLKRYNMRLNSLKCTFDIGSCNFLEFLITSEGLLQQFTE